MAMGHSIEKQLDISSELNNVFERFSNIMKAWSSNTTHVMTNEELRAYTESVWKQGYDAAMAEMGVNVDE